MTDLASSLLIDTISGLVGVFAGAILALWVDRKADQRQADRERAQQEEELAASRKLVLSSVVKNASEAKQLGTSLRNQDDPYLFHLVFEIAVWEATRAQFVRIASVDERVLLTRFFDKVRGLTQLIDFHRRVRADLEISQSRLDAGDRKLLESLEERLRNVANDIRIDGLVIVSDLGDAMHRRLLGIKETGESGQAA